MCKSPPTGKNGGVYFLDILERSRKPELVLVGQWIWSQGLERPEGAQKGRLTFSEAKGVLGDPGRPGNGLEVRLWVLMVAASLSGTCLSLGYQPVLAASSNPESSWGSGVLGVGGRGGQGLEVLGSPWATSSKSLWLLALSQRAVAGTGGCLPASPGTEPQPVPTPGNYAESAGRTLSGPCAANSATRSLPPAGLPTL